MRTKMALPPMFLVLAVASCDRAESPAVASTPTEAVEELLASFMSVGGHEGDPVRVASGSWSRIADQDMATAIGKYVEEAGIGVRCRSLADCPGDNSVVLSFGETDAGVPDVVGFAYLRPAQSGSYRFLVVKTRKIEGGWEVNPRPFMHSIVHTGEKRR